MSEIERQARSWLRRCERTRLKPRTLAELADWLAGNKQRLPALQEERQRLQEREVECAPRGLRPLLVRERCLIPPKVPRVPAQLRASLPQIVHGELAREALHWLVRLYPLTSPAALRLGQKSARTARAAAERRDFQAWLTRGTAEREVYLQLERLWDGVLLAEFELVCAGVHCQRLPELSTLTVKQLEQLAYTQARLTHQVRSAGNGHTRAYDSCFGPQRLRHYGFDEGSRAFFGGKTLTTFELNARTRCLKMQYGEIYLQVENHLGWPFELEVGPYCFCVSHGEFGVQYGDGPELELYGQLDGVEFYRLGQRLALTPKQFTGDRLQPQQVFISHHGRLRRTAWDERAQQRRAQWREGVVNFENVRLMHAANTFNRFHADVRLDITRMHLYSRRITAQLRVNQPRGFYRQLLKQPGMGNGAVVLTR